MVYDGGMSNEPDYKEIRTPEELQQMMTAIKVTGVLIERLDMRIIPGNASAADWSEFFIAMSELHRAAGGRGLIFVADGDRITAREVTDADIAIEQLIYPPR